MVKFFALILLGIAGMSACARSGCRTAAASEPRTVVDGAIDNSARDSAIVLLVSFHPGKGYADTCTGTFIAPNLLLTAAHCIPGIAKVATGAKTYAFLGTDFTPYRSQLPEPGDGRWIPVSGFSHDTPLPDYEKLTSGLGSGDPPTHDVGIAQLERPANIQPLPVAYGAVTRAGQRIRIVGYGAASRDENSADSGGIKRTAFGTVLAIFASAGIATVLDVGIRAGSDRSACRGDSGAPGLLSTATQDWVVGIVSGGPPDCTHGYFESVDASRPFIESALTRNAASLQSSGTCAP